MNTCKDLYYYECKKIWDRKLVKVSFAICLVLVMITGTVRIFGSYVVDGEVLGTVYDEIRMDQSYAAALNGKEIDQQLLEEMVSAYRKIPDTLNQHYTASPEYQKYARPYSQIFNFTVSTTNLLPSDILSNWEPNEEDLYQQRQEHLENSWEGAGLSKREISFWQQREDKIDKPVVYQQHEGYAQMFYGFETIGFISILFVSISLSGIFPEEHNRKTDQLVLSSPMGKKKLYWAKLAAGISCAIVAVFVFCLVISIITFTLYGSEGFGAAFQLFYSNNSDPISCGQALLIAYGMMLVTVVFIGVVVMILSELLRSNIAALAISSGLFMLSMFVNIPSYYRAAAQIYGWFPWKILIISNIFGKYTMPVLGMHLTSYQAVPILYLVIGAIIAVMGKKIYERYQVSGR